MKKEITARFMVCIHGEYLLLDNLPEEEQKQIAAEWNDRALRTAGYLPEQETEHAV